jgi:PAS domain S-box-containing protein
MGHLAVLDSKPMPFDSRIADIFRIFAARATAEMQRLRAERAVLDREEKLGRLVSGAMDAIIELDGSLRVSQFNPAAEAIFGCKASDVLGASAENLVTEDSAERFVALLRDLESAEDGRRSRWVPGGLQAKRVDGSVFPAEATVSIS